jgi:hypothetical protein
MCGDNIHVSTGLPETLRSRKKKIQETLLQVFFFSVYMFLVGILYAVTLVKSRGRFDPVSGFDEVDTDRDFDSPLFKLLAVVIVRLYILILLKMKFQVMVGFFFSGISWFHRQLCLVGQPACAQAVVGSFFW